MFLFLMIVVLVVILLLLQIYKIIVNANKQRELNLFYVRLMVNCDGSQQPLWLQRLLNFLGMDVEPCGWVLLLA